MKSIRTFLIVTLAVSILGAVSAHEITLTDEFDPQFSLWLPDEWDVTLSKDTIRAVSSDGLLYCVVWDIEGVEEDQEAEKIIRERVESVLDDVEYDPDTELEIEGMDAKIVEGTAKHEDKEVIFLITAFRYADDKVGVVSFVGDPEVRNIYKGTIIDILSTVEPDAEFKAEKARQDREESEKDD